MASVAGVSGSARGRRALDASLNLVPFIDLLSCCIAFLLITAVWSAVARIDVGNGGASTAAVEDGPPSPPAWTLYVAPDGWSLRAPDGAALTATRATLPGLLRAHAVGEPLVVRATDGVAYATVVAALDSARSAGIRVISLAGDGE
ncbi:MAG: ExbD/TolR family protein [Polyangia bacterium]